MAELRDFMDAFLLLNPWLRALFGFLAFLGVATIFIHIVNWIDKKLKAYPDATKRWARLNRKMKKHE
jgi:uncharacterized protein HemY